MRAAHVDFRIAGNGVSGRLLLDDRSDNHVLLVCIHGGGCNGSYFDLKGFSVARTAVAAGYSVLLADRPGHAGNPALDGPPIPGAAAALHDFLEEVLTANLPSASGVAIIGHSIGGAVALTLAAANKNLPLIGVAVSGIGDRPSAEALGWYGRVRGADSPGEPPTDFFFGPEGSFEWRAPIALRTSSEPWLADDLEDTLIHWPERWTKLASRIAVPVHLRFAEHERIWERDGVALDRIRRELSSSRLVDIGILPEGGHLYEIHKRWPELIESQLDFFKAASQLEGEKRDGGAGLA